MDMAKTQGTSLLKRKAADGRTEQQARAMSPDKAMRLGIALASDKGLGLALDVTKVARSTIPHRAIQATLDSESLLAILEGQNGEPGAVAVDMQLLAGLVEHQTYGQVIGRPAVDRKPSQVDAALVAPFLEDMLARFVVMLGEDGRGPEWLQHYKFGAMTPDPRALSLALSAQDFHFFVLDISLDGGKKIGTMALAFPDIKVKIEVPEEEAESNSEKFQSGVKQATTTLNAVVGRMSMPISQLQRLQVGDVLELPENAMKSARLETLAGEEIAEVRIGQLGGMRAVCVPGLAKAQQAEDAVNGMAADLPSIGAGTPDLPEMPQMGGLDTPLPEMAEMPAMGGMDDFGGLPDLDGGDLPALAPMGDIGIGLDADGLEDFDTMDGLDDLDELIQLGDDDIGDPSALMDLDFELTGT